MVANTLKTLKLSLGPVLFFWPREKVLRFYEEMADQSLDVIYLGETVCARRHEVKTQDWIDLAKDLAASGKEVVLSSQVLLESEIDLRRLRKLVEQGEFKLEANDLGAAKLARDHGLPFVAGQTLNIYNEVTLEFFMALGSVRWVTPVEISAKKIEAVLEKVPCIEAEVFGWGLMPLAFSARCFTARYYDLRKDLCEFKCQEHPDALLIRTREGKPFLRLNGIETMSAGCQCLLPYHDEMQQLGVKMLRISPQAEHTARIIELHAACLQEQVNVEEAVAELQALALGELIDGYWRGVPGSAVLNKDIDVLLDAAHG